MTNAVNFLAIETSGRTNQNNQNVNTAAQSAALLSLVQACPGALPRNHKPNTPRRAIAPTITVGKSPHQPGGRDESTMTRTNRLFSDGLR